MDDSKLIPEQDLETKTPPERSGRSPLGIISLGLGLLGIVLMLGCCVLAFFYIFSDLELVRGVYNGLVTLAIVLIVLIGVVSLAGVSTGVIGTMRKEPRVSFSIAGTIISGLGLVSFCLLLSFGLCLFAFVLSRLGGL